MAENNEMQAKWYVVHTYSGYENKVKTDLEKTIENRHLENEILEVRVPMQEVTEVKEGDEASWNQDRERCYQLRGWRYSKRYCRCLERYCRRSSENGHE